MPIVNRFHEMAGEIATWRRDIHAHPELMFEVHRTAGFVADKLRSFGCDEVVEGIGRIGVVGVITGRETASGRAVGLRADMDALPIREQTGLPHASKTEGLMHACGHDGHTAMLLGAAKYLCETRNFDGTAVVIFQPAEENGGGGKLMVDDGLMERFAITEVYGMHNWPGWPVGSFAIRAGPCTATADIFTIDIEGFGAHAAKPHKGTDPALVAASLIQSLQSIVSRNVDPLERVVVSVTVLRCGEAHNVIAQTAQLKGTVRTLNPEIRDLVEERMNEIVSHQAAAFGAKATLNYERGYPMTVNHAAQTTFAADVAADIAGEPQIDRNTPPAMGGEDFSYMLQARPGAFIFLGNGDTAGLHNPKYDFNDEAIPVGCSYWVKLVEKAMPANGE